MISNTHIYEELLKLEQVCEEEKDVWKKAMLKSNLLCVKLLHNMRTNQANAMKSNGIDLIPNKKGSHEEE